MTTMGFGIYQFYRLFRQQSFRERRIKLFIDTFQPQASDHILDVGGYFYDWKSLPIASRVTLLNIDYYAPGSQVTDDRFTSDAGTACDMRYSNQSFDIAYSNSVIEHVGDFSNQQRMAAEIRRVGRQIFVQTPNRWFFIEPHFLVVFLHYLPWKLAKRLLPFCSLRAWFRGGESTDLKKFAEELRFVSYREMKELFPDCKIYKEKWFGMTKSFIAIKHGRPV